MRLRTENIHEYRLKCNTVAQITLDDDFNVPDTKDDIELIVKEWGNVQTDNQSRIRRNTIGRLQIT